MTDGEVFRRYGDYYDILYRNKDYAAEAEYVARTLHVVHPKTRRILEFGSGTGRHGALLASSGFDVLGVERSPQMLARATRAAVPQASTNGSFTAVEGDLRTIDLGQRFDAVVALFHVISYQTTDADLTAAFRTAAAHVSPGGVFLFDVWHGPAVLAERPERRVKQVESDDVHLTRIAEPRLDADDHVVTVEYTITATSKADGSVDTVREEHRLRYLFPDEIEAFAADAGFNIERSEEFGSGGPVSDRTWGVAYLLRRQP